MRRTNQRGLLLRVKQQGLRVVHRIQGRRFLHFLHVGKTGGTALKYALRQHAADERYALYLHPHSVRLRNVPRGEQFFFLVRDPISRFVSGFYSRQRQGLPRYASTWKESERIAFAEFATPNQLALALSSPNRAARARAQSAMQSIQHVRDSYWKWFGGEQYFKSRMTDVFFVGRQERLAADFELLKARIGLPRGAELPGDNVHAHRNDSRVDRALDNQALANLRDWYADDYRFVALCEPLMEHQQRERSVALAG